MIYAFLVPSLLHTIVIRKNLDQSLVYIFAFFCQIIPLRSRLKIGHLEANLTKNQNTNSCTCFLRAVEEYFSSKNVEFDLKCVKFVVTGIDSPSKQGNIVKKSKTKFPISNVMKSLGNNYIIWINQSDSSTCCSRLLYLINIHEWDRRPR